jgi:hypothetical protein
MKKIEKIGIKATEYPDWDYVINELMSLADKMNEIIEVVNIAFQPKYFMGKENDCSNCGRMLPGGYVQVNSLDDPHCLICGRPKEEWEK